MIDVEKDGDVWIVTLNRSEKANALTEDMLKELCHIVEAAGQVKSLVITGAGKVFSAGADLDAARAGLAVSPLWERLSGGIAALPGLSIAALNGTAAGGAMGMVLACDLRVAVPSAKVFYPVMKLGFLPQPSDPARLTALVGPSRAKMVLMAGQKIEAQEALQWGLFDRLSDAPLETARAMAQDVLTARFDHIEAIKNMLR